MDTFSFAQLVFIVLLAAPFLCERLLDPKASLFKAAQNRSQESIDTAKPAPQWFAVSTTRLELAGSGFYITLKTGVDDHPYTGHSPEGYVYGWSEELEKMKRYLEARAAERSEFAPPSTQWLAKIMK